MGNALVEQFKKRQKAKVTAATGHALKSWPQAEKFNKKIVAKDAELKEKVKLDQIFSFTDDIVKLKCMLLEFKNELVQVDLALGKVQSRFQEASDGAVQAYQANFYKIDD
ncbi:hypothetical protein Fot_42606 [Forsythia ovata]|uniref:Uncharacterized protein n=1 Tax=Forsythia ovata TaxID=205694 RepID=A0ABD1RMM3_9LAMI